MTHPQKTPLIEGAWSREGLEDLLARVEGAEGADGSFRNELGNLISISVAREIPDTDLVCAACRWRAGHSPTCEYASTPWPTFLLSDDRALLRIQGPSSVSENYLTPLEMEHLLAALLRALIAQAETPLPTRIDEEN